MSERILSMRRVGKTHGTGALVNVDLDIAPGELVAVTGRSGSGKTTLLNLAGALDTPTTGTIRIAGQDLAELSRADLARLRRVSVGYVGTVPGFPSHPAGQVGGGKAHRRRMIPGRGGGSVVVRDREADHMAKGPSESAAVGLECWEVACEYGRIVAEPG